MWKRLKTIKEDRSMKTARNMGKALQDTGYRGSEKSHNSGNNSKNQQLVPQVIKRLLTAKKVISKIKNQLLE